MVQTKAGGGNEKPHIVVLRYLLNRIEVRIREG
jgi:hypothetical protein